MITALLIAAACGQTIEYQKSYHEDELIVIDYQPPEDAARSAVFWNVIDSRLNYEQVVYPSGKQKVFAAAPPNEYLIFANVLIEDSEGNWIPKTEQLRFIVTARGPPGPGPEPDPDPDPDPDPPGPDPDPTIPDDQFANLGRRVAAWSQELDLEHTREIGTVYRQARSRLLTVDPNSSMTIDETAEWITSELSTIYGRYPGLADSYAPLRAKIAPVWNQYISRQSTKFDVAAFYLALALGLGA